MGSHLLSRALREQGHEVRLMPAQDMEAIAEAADRENIWLCAMALGGYRIKMGHFH